MNKIIKYLLSLLLMLSASAYSQKLDLETCRNLALENNKQIKKANLELEASKQEKKYAFSKYFPKIDAQAMAMKSSDYMLKQQIPAMNLPVYDGNPVNLSTPTQFAYFPGMEIASLDYSNTASLSLIQPLFMGGKIFLSNQLAKLNVEAHQDALALSEEDILAKTEMDYWKIIALKEKRKVLKGYATYLSKLAQDVRLACDAGLLQKEDLLQVQLKQKEVAVKKLKLENGIALFKMAFCQHLGISYSPNFELKDSLMPQKEPASFKVDHESALARRKEFAMLNKSLEAEHLKKKIAAGEKLPQLAVGAQALYLDVFKQEHTYGIAFARLSVPISDWWSASYKNKEHKIKEEIAQNELDDKSSLMLLQMDKAYKDLETAFAQIKLEDLAVKQAQEHQKVVDDNCKAGVLDTSKALESRAQLQNTMNQLLEAKSDYQLKIIAYKKSIAQK
jgi:outer membrane protein TolC